MTYSSVEGEIEENFSYFLAVLKIYSYLCSAISAKRRLSFLGLSYGVMVAQQVLVLFVVVRIRLGQHEEGQYFSAGLLSLYTKNLTGF